MPQKIEQLCPEWIPELVKLGSYNDDLRLSYIEADKKKWAGEQRNGIAYNIPGATSHADHAYKAMDQPFHLAARTPLPQELIDSVDSLRSNSDP